MKVFEFESEFELYAVFFLAGRMDCMARLNARCSALYWLCPALRGQRCTGSAQRCAMCVAWSALYWLCPALRNVRCVVSVVLALPSAAQWALHGQRCLPLHAVYDERRVLFNVVLVHLIVVCTTLHSQRCSALH